MKRPAEARDAREVAKKLLKSGAITAITKAPKRNEQSGFKRPRGLKRMLSESERTVSGFQPFSATQPEDQEMEVRPRVKVSNHILKAYVINNMPYIQNVLLISEYTPYTFAI